MHTRMSTHDREVIMSIKLKLSAPDSGVVFTSDPHRGKKHIARSGMVWRQRTGKDDAVTVQAFAVACANDYAADTVINAATPCAYGGAICLVRFTDTDGSLVEYISVDKSAVPDRIRSVCIFTHGFKGGMPYPLGSLDGHLSTSVDRPALLDNERTWSNFRDLGAGTMALGLVLNRRTSTENSWAQMVEDHYVIPIDYLDNLSVSLEL